MNLSRCSRAVVLLLALSLLFGQCPGKLLLPICEVNLNVENETGKAGNPLGSLLANNDCFGYVRSIKSNAVQNTVEKKKSHSLVADWLKFIDPDSPPDVVEEKANQFRNLKLEDISDQRTRDMLEFLGFEEYRYPKPVGFTPGWYFKKMALKKMSPYREVN